MFNYCKVVKAVGGSTFHDSTTSIYDTYNSRYDERCLTKWLTKSREKYIPSRFNFGVKVQI